MRVLVLSNMYPPHAYGGYERSCMDVVDRWRHSGDDVLVLTSQIRVEGEPDPPSSERDRVWRDLRIYWEDHKFLNPPGRVRFSWERHNERCLQRALSAFRPDVVSVWGMGFMSMGLLSILDKRRAPTVLVICDEWPVYGPLVDSWSRAFAARPGLARIVGAISRLPTRLPAIDELGPPCFVSQSLLREMQTRSRWTFEDSTVVYSGIASEEFSFDPRLEPWQWRLLYVGRVHPQKGIETVLRALPGLPSDAVLTLVGRGDLVHLSDLQQMARNLGVADRVRFTTCDRSDLNRHYAGADVVVFPSKEEFFGLVPLEAMACGTPVAATSVGGASEFLVDGENCLTFSAGDSGELVAVLKKMAEDGDLRQRIVSGGRATAAELSADRLAAVLAEWHRYVVHMSARPEDRVLSAISLEKSGTRGAD